MCMEYPNGQIVAFNTNTSSHNLDGWSEYAVSRDGGENWKMYNNLKKVGRISEPEDLVAEAQGEYTVSRDPELELALKIDAAVKRVRPRTGEDKRRALVEEWYREELKEAVPPLLARWQPLLGVKVERFFV